MHQFKHVSVIISACHRKTYGKILDFIPAFTHALSQVFSRMLESTSGHAHKQFVWKNSRADIFLVTASLSACVRTPSIFALNGISTTAATILTKIGMH